MATDPITPKVLVGLVGAGIGLSRTPLMHEREGARSGLRYCYQLFDTDTPELARLDIGEILRAAHICGYAGLNITYPFKQAIVPHLDELSDNAARIGAVNTVVFSDGRVRGHNTDLWGYAEGFRRQMKGACLDRVAMVGAGGAGAAVSRALLQLGVRKLFITDLDEGRADEMAARLSADFPEAHVGVVDADELGALELNGLVNTTPVGMAKNPGMAVADTVLVPGLWVSDIVYFPLETELLRRAANRGCRTLTGAHMAVFQAVRAFELFTGVRPDAERMKADFEAFQPGAPAG